jgi:hypothetical protein
MRVWFNLHRRDWSTRAVSGARVQPAAAVRLLDAVCHVNEAERQRVIARRCRSVHAWINGTAAKPVTEPAGVLVSYQLTSPQPTPTAGTATIWISGVRY